VRSAARFVARVAVALTAVVAVVAAIGLAVLPAFGLYRPMTALSGSMTPTFSPGDLVLVTPEPLTEVREGQVIAYSAPVAGHPVVTHRVVEVVTPGAAPVIRTKGDANTADDPWTARLHGDTAWHLRLVVPHAGWALRLMRTPLVHSLTVYGIPALLCLIWLSEIWRRREPDSAHVA
jgi:signal peptidase